MQSANISCGRTTSTRSSYWKQSRSHTISHVLRHVSQSCLWTGIGTALVLLYPYLFSFWIFQGKRSLVQSGYIRLSIWIQFLAGNVIRLDPLGKFFGKWWRSQNLIAVNVQSGFKKCVDGSTDERLFHQDDGADKIVAKSMEFVLDVERFVIPR